MVGGSMGRPPAGGNLQFDATFMPAIDLHFGRLADHDEIRLDAGIHFDKGVWCNAIAPFLHVPKVIGCPTSEQTEIARDGKPVDHSRSGTLFITCPARVQNIVFNLSYERVALPASRVADTDRIHMRVVNDHTLARTDPSQDVTHFVEADLIKTELVHLRRDTVPHLFEL